LFYCSQPGLSDDHVYALFVSSDGALWVGQANGRVVRKLGNDFKIVVPGRTPMEPSERVTSFAQTKDGAVWFTYERSGRVSR
jgi:ligand-binding sensor domain-containing protein